MLSPEEKRERANAASRKWKLNNPERFKASTKAWREANSDKVKAANKAWREENPNATAEWRAHNPERNTENNTKWKRDNPDKVRGYHLKAKFGMTHEDYDRMLESQGFVCAICKEPYEKKYHIDHDHETGIVRGLLCDICNRGLGYFKDSSLRLSSAITYLSMN
jgi:hypothetical protein